MRLRIARAQFIERDCIGNCEATDRRTTQILEVGSPTHECSEVGGQCTDIGSA